MREGGGPWLDLPYFLVPEVIRTGKTGGDTHSLQGAEVLRVLTPERETENGADDMGPRRRGAKSVEHGARRREQEAKRGRASDERVGTTHEWLQNRQAGDNEQGGRLDGWSRLEG